jgi:hypothetical protein
VTRAHGRSQKCSSDEARNRRNHARKFLEVAEIAAGDHGQDSEYASVAASLAVLAGIAAADAACCKALGERSRSQDHRDAERFMRRISGGNDAAKQLRALLDLKDEAHYGLFDLGAVELKRALRRARAVLEFAEDTLRR